MSNIELDNEFIELLYGLTNTPVPANLSLAELKDKLKDAAAMMKSANSGLGVKKASDNKNGEVEDEEPKGPAILIVDDLGVITYQLKVLLSQFKYDIDCSQEIYDAVNKFKKRKYDYVVMDLFIPTEREGFILLTELKKMAASFGKNTIIGIITASPRKEIEQQCKARGADFFLEKNNDWQNSLTTIMKDYIGADKGFEEDF